MFNDPSGMEGEAKGGTWFYDKQNQLRFDSQHTYSNFPSDKGTAMGVDFYLQAGAQKGDKQSGSYFYKNDGTREYIPPIAEAPTDPVEAPSIVKEKVKYISNKM